MKKNSGATSTQLLRRMNSAAVLGYALESETFNATEAMEATGLTRATVLGLCDELAELGWIDELGDARAAGQYSMGRPARRYRLRETAGYILGIDAGQHTATVMVADLRGKTLARTAAVMTTEEPVARVVTVRKIAEAAMAAAGVHPDHVFIVVVGVPAPVDEHGRSPAGDEFWHKMNPGFPDSFDDSAHAIVENDANLAALAERARGSGRGVRSFATLLSGERLGSGLVVDDALIRGSHGGAGEMRFLDLVEGVGSAEGLGSLAREWALAARDDGALPAGSMRGKVPRSEISAEAVFSAAVSGDSAAEGIVDRLADRLARVSIVLSSLLDVEKVVVGGAIALGVQPVIEKASAILKADFAAPVPELAASELGAEGVVLGALTCGLSLLREAPLKFTPRN
ncbi:ROK family protein [Specibacter sp. AOP5-B1-6]|uniref:ROK family protein n=1 Tax=Specibacter sp. AOP5-B1-6 TaxID=3457653 RepID=UPI00402BB6FC